MSYRIRLGRQHDNELERVPMQVALTIEKHLQNVADAVGTHSRNPARCHCLDSNSSVSQFQAGDYTVVYRVNTANREVEVLALVNKG